jgi:hypothetical protein
MSPSELLTIGLSLAFPVFHVMVQNHWLLFLDSLLPLTTLYNTCHEYQNQCMEKKKEGKKKLIIHSIH